MSIFSYVSFLKGSVKESSGPSALDTIPADDLYRGNNEVYITKFDCGDGAKRNTFGVGLTKELMTFDEVKKAASELGDRFYIGEKDGTYDAKKGLRNGKIVIASDKILAVAAENNVWLREMFKKEGLIITSKSPDAPDSAKVDPRRGRFFLVRADRYTPTP
jgi:hypothetical protein